jgi:GAF domain-containing protein
MDSSYLNPNTIDRDKEVNLLCTEVLGYTSEDESRYEVEVEKYNNWLKQLSELFESSQHELNYKDYCEELLSFTNSIRKVQEYVWNSYFDTSVSVKSLYLNNAMRLIHECLKAQVCAIFLIDKYGFLARRAFYGVDIYGAEIEPEWFADERYEIDQRSFVGRTAFIDPDGVSHFGAIQYTHNLEELDQLDYKNLNAYKTRLGNPIGRAISVPINNRNGTIGVLRILNYYDPNPHIGRVIPPHKSKLNDRDIIWLSLFSSQISNTIFDYERVFNRRFFSKIIAHAIAKPDQLTKKSSKSVSSFLNGMLEIFILNEGNPFVFAIIRVLDSEDNLVVISKSSFNNLFSINRIDNPISRSNSNAFVNLALDSGKYIIIPDIVHSLSQFNNKDWVGDQGFTTFCCFPLTFQGIPLGTLSMYTARSFSYDSHCIEYIQTIVDSLSLYLHISLGAEDSNSTIYIDKGLNDLRRKSISADGTTEWSFRTIKQPDGYGKLAPERIRAAVRDISGRHKDPH